MTNDSSNEIDGQDEDADETELSREQKLEELGYLLSDIPNPAAVYKAVVIDGNTAYVSGAIPIAEGQVASEHCGKVPSQVSVEDAHTTAALCAANLLRVLHAELGSLDRIERVLKLTGYVNSEGDFTQQHVVINGASQLLIDVLGMEAGMGARAAVGVAGLPLGVSVEVDLVLKVK